MSGLRNQTRPRPGRWRNCAPGIQASRIWDFAVWASAPENQHVSKIAKIRERQAFNQSLPLVRLVVAAPERAGLAALPVAVFDIVPLIDLSLAFGET